MMTTQEAAAARASTAPAQNDGSKTSELKRSPTQSRLKAGPGRLNLSSLRPFDGIGVPTKDPAYKVVSEQFWTSIKQVEEMCGVRGCSVDKDGNISVNQGGTKLVLGNSRTFTLFPIANEILSSRHK